MSATWESRTAYAWEAAPSGKRGGRQIYSDAAIQACLTLKVVFGMALRQTTGLVTSLLKLAGLDWPVPNFSTLSRRQKDLAVVLSRRASTGPMHLLIDSTGGGPALLVGLFGELLPQGLWLLADAAR